MKNLLLKDFAICPLVMLPSNFDRLVPTPLVIDEFLGLWFARVKLGEFVAIIIRCDVKSWLCLLAADDECTLNNGIVFDAVDGGGAKDVFAGSFQAGEETA